MQAILSISIIIICSVFCITASPFFISAEALVLSGRIFDFVSLNTPQLLILAAWFPLTRLLMGKNRALALITDHGALSPLLWLKAFAISLLCLSLSFIQGPAAYLSAEPGQRLPLFILVLLITPLQCLAEELMARVMITRIFFSGRLEGSKKRILLSCLASGSFFLLLHLPGLESPSGCECFYYLLYGFCLNLVSIRAKSFETAWAVHSANNMFIALILNYEGSVYDTLPLFVRSGKTNMAVSYLMIVLITICVTKVTDRHFLISKEAGNGQN